MEKQEFVPQHADFLQTSIIPQLLLKSTFAVQILKVQGVD